MPLLKFSLISILVVLLAIQSVMADPGDLGGNVPSSSLKVSKIDMVKSIVKAALPNSKVDALLLLGALGVTGFAAITCLLGLPAIIPSLALLVSIVGFGIFGIKKGVDIFSKVRSLWKINKVQLP